MNCQEFQNTILEAALGELSAEDTRQHEKHRLECEGCRESYGRYLSLVAALNDAPLTEPTRAESVRLTEALHGLTSPRASQPLIVAPRGFLAFAATLTVVFLAMVAGLMRMGPVSFPGQLSYRSGAALFAAGVVILFVTTLIPIAVSTKAQSMAMRVRRY